MTGVVVLALLAAAVAWAARALAAITQACRLPRSN